MKKILSLALVCLSLNVFAKPVEVSKVIARETIAGSKVTAVYMDIQNDSDESLKLTAVNTKVSKKAEIHQSSQVKCHEGNDSHAMYKMRQLDSVEIPAHETLSLAPGGYHIMLIDLLQPLKQGDKVALTLVFSDKTQKEVTALVTSNL